MNGFGFGFRVSAALAAAFLACSRPQPPPPVDGDEPDGSTSLDGGLPDASTPPDGSVGETPNDAWKTGGLRLTVESVEVIGYPWKYACAEAVSDSGAVAGDAANESGTPVAFRLTPEGVFEELGPAEDIRILGMDGEGVVVASFRTGSVAYARVLLSGEREAIPLTVVHTVARNGTILGEINNRYAVLAPDGTLTEFPDPSGEYGTYAGMGDVNSSGHVVGYIIGMQDPIWQATVWRNGQPELLPFQGAFNAGLAISDKGYIAGNVSYGKRMHAAVWREGGLAVIWPREGYTNAYGRAIADNGLVAGDEDGYENGYQVSASFLWRGGERRNAEELASHLEGWQITWVSDLTGDDEGGRLVGCARVDGLRVAFKLDYRLEPDSPSDGGQ